MNTQPTSPLGKVLAGLESLLPDLEALYTEPLPLSYVQERGESVVVIAINKRDMKSRPIS
ncbi:hypothetical protein [Nitrosospira multiformis]|uniref:Uncharacterized protein n=1 Tax=Nitrosospira multiformis TaxID=1231 RepID=A0A1I7I2E3_9PROT|nr:hypothetical protein [Nitrosospira multiformis]SFU66946.1 hypothetical protein SAMN05216417_113102 [Nitrosospira multiformis]